MKMTEEELLVKYNILINEILDECDWKTHFTGEEVCGLVHNILTKNGEEPIVTPKELHKVYSNQVDNLNLTPEQWRDQYGVPQIIHLIYEILIDLNDVDLPTP